MIEVLFQETQGTVASAEQYFSVRPPPDHQVPHLQKLKQNNTHLKTYYVFFLKKKSKVQYNFKKLSMPLSPG